LTREKAEYIAFAKEIQIGRFMAGYFSNTLLAVRDILDNPGIPVASGRGRSLKTAARRPTQVKIPKADKLFIAGGRQTKASQRFAAERTEAVTVASGLYERFRWKPLTKRWIMTGARQGLRSRTYWKKTGKLASIYRGNLPRALSIARNSVNYGRGATKLGAAAITQEIRAHRLGLGATAKNAVVVRLNLKRPKLNQVFDDILAAPFFSEELDMARPPDVPFGLYSVVDINRLRYPEYHRPWLRRFAMMMGRRMRSDLKKL
jgi:hypothetical protein